VALTRIGDHPAMRRLWLVLLCAALVTAARVGTAAAAAEDRGIVVRVQPPRVVIRELDGTRARFVVNRATVVTLNGHRVRLRRLRPGDVATVDHVGRVATTIQAIRP
jgi:hypothetical protein